LRPARDAIVTTEAALAALSAAEAVGVAGGGGGGGAVMANDEDDSFYELTPEDLAGMVMAADAKRKVRTYAWEGRTGTEGGG
jgi:hypothetical protein